MRNLILMVALAVVLVAGCSTTPLHPVLHQTGGKWQEGSDAAVLACDKAALGIAKSLVAEDYDRFVAAYNRCLFDNGAVL